jgi:hypothetical protein
MKKTEISLTIEAVLKGQGADPEVVSIRRPGLLKVAQSAIEIGQSLILPDSFHKTLGIISLNDDSVILEGGIFINSTRIAGLMRGSEVVEAYICTIGDQLEKASAELFQTDPSLALALDGLANAAIDQLVEKVCCEVEAEAQAEELNVSIPISPGSSEWPLETGQPVLFKAIKPDPAIIRLSESFLMIPKKSSSFILGIGKDIVKHGKTCDQCNARETCRYKIRKNF